MPLTEDGVAEVHVSHELLRGLARVLAYQKPQDMLRAAYVGEKTALATVVRSATLVRPRHVVKPRKTLPTTESSSVPSRRELESS